MSDATTISPAGIQHQLSIPLPKALAARIHMHLTIHTHHLLLFITTRTPETPGSPAPLGSFVYALPSTTQPTPLSTTLYFREDTIDVATRLAKILAKRTMLPVYVGCSVSFSAAGRGGNVDEEMEGIRNVVRTVVERVQAARIVEGVEEVVKGVEGVKV
ncbi:hypothetical protein BZA05DRAFT_400968 [Tricharina praecox]|uniref:uncharacterized protein n=1 Tax=Tricharina praecox TaxID=43433 RepID=UPI0022205A26|nr:uncharacterized protein BZA05DRAFT_400968 [Tricharina praecox]KAI5850100.1 hypothetical protein BZA05DRAFT_400968 [Tricharina praecox]